MIANGKVSSRTLTLLDQERTRYQFFASMSNEIQFEYSFQSDLLTLSEWGLSCWTECAVGASGGE